jgi:hypothetical protein
MTKFLCVNAAHVQEEKTKERKKKKLLLALRFHPTHMVLFEKQMIQDHKRDDKEKKEKKKTREDTFEQICV